MFIARNAGSMRYKLHEKILTDKPGVMLPMDKIIIFVHSKNRSLDKRTNNFSLQSLF